MENIVAVDDDTLPSPAAKLDPVNLEFYKLMFQDRVDRLAETKKFINDLVRWAVTLNLAAPAFVLSLEQASRSIWYAVLPVSVLVFSMSLFVALRGDIERGRAELTNLRHLGGGIAWQLHGLNARNYTSGNWGGRTFDTYSAVLLLSSIGAVGAIATMALMPIELAK